MVWGDFDAWADLDLSRYPELRLDPLLGVYTEVSEPSRVDVANYFAGVMSGVVEGRMVFNVADAGSQIVGHCGIFPKSDHAENRHIGTLGMLVLREWRGKGVGGELLTKSLGDCRGKFEVVELAVMERNEVAQRLYRRHGFEVRGRLPRAFRRGDQYFDELVMSREVE